MKSRITAVCILLLLAAGRVAAQQPPNDPLAEYLFPPEMLMQHQQAIGLSDEQKNVIKTELRKVQIQFTELQFQLQDEMEAMTALVKQDRIDEQQVMVQLDKILNHEREIKRLQLGLVVRLKNLLTLEQQARLRELRDKHIQR